MGMRELMATAASRHGVLSASCGPPHGVPRGTLRSRALREGWPCPYPGVWVAPGHELTAAARTFAAAVAVGGQVAITGWSALAHHGLVRSWPTTIELLLPDRLRRIALPRVITRWTEVWPAELVDVGGVAVTSVARSLAECGRDLELAAARRIAFDALGKGLLTVAQLDAEIAVRGRFAGRGMLRRLSRDLRGDGSESGFEFDARDRLTAVGLEPLPGQPAVATSGTPRRIDLAYPGDVGVECHSWRHHSSVEDLERDARRANEIAELDRWLLLHLTHRMFLLDWERFETTLRRCLARRGRAP